MKKLIYLLMFLILLALPSAFAIDFAKGAVSFWDFTDGSLADSWGNDTDGCAAVNTPTETSTDCASGDCFDFDAGGDYLNCGAEVGGFLGGTCSAMTISMWYNADVISSGSTQYGIVTLSPLSNNAGSLATWIQTGVQYGGWEGGASYFDPAYTPKISTLTHFVWRYNGSAMAWFINGTEVAKESEADAQDFTDPFMIGVRYSADKTFDGTIDEVGVWKRALETEEIINLFNDGASCNPVANPTGCGGEPSEGTFSDFNVTSNNIVGTESSIAWNTGGGVNITSNLLSLTVTTSENANISCSFSDLNYSDMIAVNANYQAATTDTTSHSYIIYDDLEHYSQCIYCSIRTSSGVENSSSGSGCLNITYFPEPSILKPSEKTLEFHIDSVSLDFNLSDTESNWTVDDGVNFSISATGVLANSTATALGEHILNITANNTFGSFNSTLYTLTVQDTRTPNILLPANATLEYLTDSISLDINATDEDTVMFYLNDSVTEFSIVDSTGVLTNTSSINVSVNILEIKVNDSSANANTTHYNITVIDSTPPTFDSVPANTTLEYHVNNLTVDFGATDGSGVDSYSINDTNLFSISSDGFLSNKTGTSIGKYYVNVSVDDIYGNVRWHIFNVNVSDSNSPNILAPANKTVEFCSESISVDFNATDESATDDWWLDDAVNFSIDSDGIFINYTNLTRGVFITNVSVNDTSGNMNFTLYNITVIDSTAPTDNNPSDATHALSKPATVNWILTDCAPGYYYVHVNGTEQNESTTWASGINLGIWANTTEVGTYNYTIFYNDSSGNSGRNEVIITVIPNNIPEVRVNSPANNTLITIDSVTLSVNVTDADGENMTVYFMGDGVLINWTNRTSDGVSEITNNSEINYTWESITHGTHNWSAIAYDNIDNSTENLSILTVDIAVLYLSLDGVNESRKYEYMTTVSTNVSLINDTGTVCYDITDGTNRYDNYSCGANATYLIDKLVVSEFNDSSTEWNITPFDWCYQEHANGTTACGGLDTGIYSYANNTGGWLNGINGTDGDWDTNDYVVSWDIGYAYIYINYTKPIGATSLSTLTFKNSDPDAINMYNFSGEGSIVPYDRWLECWNAYPKNLLFRILAFRNVGSYGSTSYTCFNGTSWIGIQFSDAGKYVKVYEEGMWWYTTGISEKSIAIDNRTDLVELTFNLTGLNDSGYPTKTIIDLGNDGDYDAIITGHMKEDKNEIYEFNYLGNEYEKYNFTFQTQGEKVFYTNITTAGNTTNSGILNFTIKAYDLDAGNLLNYEQNFSSGLSGNDGGVINSTQSPGVFDDFQTNATYGKYNWTVIYESDTYSPYTLNGVNTTTCTSLGWFDGGSDCLLVSFSYPTTGDYGAGVYPDIDLKNIRQIDVSYYIHLGGTILPGTSSYSNGVLGFYGEGNGEIKEFFNEELEGAVWFKEDNYFYNMSVIRIDNNNYKVINYQSGGRTSVEYYNLAQLEGPIRLFAYTRGFKSSTSIGGISAAIEIHKLNVSGIMLNRSVGSYQVADTTNNQSTYEKHLIDTDSSIQRALVVVERILPTTLGAYTDMEIYLSNDNGTTYEPVVNGSTHSFDSTGTNFSIKIMMNTTNTLVSPIITSLKVYITPTSGSDIKIDVGNDLTVDYYNPIGLNSTNTPISYNGTDLGIIGYNCSGLTCAVPIKIIVNQSSMIEISEFNYSKNINPISFTSLSEYEHDSAIPLVISIASGILQLRELQLEYFGSKNITIFAYKQGEESINDTKKVYVKYSKFNLTYPSGQEYWEIYPTKRNQTNIQPYGQNSTHGIWNIRSEAYEDPINIYARFNESINSCVKYVNISVSMSTEICYQEHANESTPCGGKSTGYYTFENNLPTPGPQYIYINYTKPVHANNYSSWRVKIGNTSERTLSVESCYDADESDLMLRLNSDNDVHNSSAECYNGSVWLVLYSLEPNGYDAETNYADNASLALDGDWDSFTYAGANWRLTPNTKIYSYYLYEEGMYWNFTNQTELNNKATAYTFNTSYEKFITGMNSSDIANTYTFTDIYCSGTTAPFYIPIFCFRARCYDCVNTTDFDEACKITE